MTKGVVDVAVVERELATICIRHLCSTGYISLSDGNRVRELASQGYYSFLDYSVINWTDHLHAYVSRATIEELIRLVRDLQDFLGMPCNNLNPVGGDEGPGDILMQSGQDFLVLGYTSEVFAKIVFWTRLRIQLRSRKIEASSGMLGSKNLGEMVAVVRHVIEDLCTASNVNVTGPRDISTTAGNALAKYYGTHYFKCSQEDCDYFSEGFPTRQKRDEHERKHSLSCPEPGCCEAVVSSASLRAHWASCRNKQRPTLHEQPKREFPDIAQIMHLDPKPGRGHVGSSSIPPSNDQTSTRECIPMPVHMPAIKPYAYNTHAIISPQFISKVERRFSAQSKVYNTLLNLLKAYENGERSIKSVCDEVKLLLASAPDLLQEYQSLFLEP